MGNQQTTANPTKTQQIVRHLTPQKFRKAVVPEDVAGTDATRTNTADHTPSRPSQLRTPATRPRDSEWLQIYSPTRTPATVRMQPTDFTIDGPTLGEGSFAQVKLGTHIASGKRVAVKIIDKTKIPENMKAYAATEPGILAQLKHSNIVKLLLTHETDTEIFIYLQFLAGSDMHTFVQKKQFLEEDEARDIFVQLLDALDYIHKIGVVHRDIKLENILISNKKVNGVNKALLIDFGFAGAVPHDDYKFTDYPGSVCYAAPELLAGKPYDGTKVDVYALGVTLYVMIHGQYPFYSNDQKKLYNMVWHEQPVCAKELTGDCQDMLQQMLIKDPLMRPSIAELKSHPWMKDATNPITKQSILTPVVARLKKEVARMSPTQSRKKLMF